MFLISEGKITYTFIQIKVDDNFVTDPKNIADAFDNHFKSSVNTFCPTVTAPHSVTTHFLPRRLSLLLKSARIQSV
jgi:hypothetical protein